MKSLSYSKTAIKDLKAIPAKDSKAIREKLANHAAGGDEDVIRLRNSPYYRLRHGDWRAIFDQEGKVITVLTVAKRGEVYR
jgi:mRNA interferase RelE/StbE